MSLVCMTPGGYISFVAVGATAGGNIISVALIDTCSWCQILGLNFKGAM